MFKKIFKTIFLLTTAPGQTWKELSEEDEAHDSFLNKFIYPLIGLTSIAAFVGFFFGRKQFDVQLALKETCTVLVSSFVGFYMAAFLLDEILHLPYFGKEKNSKLTQRFVGYALSFGFVVSIIMDLLPDFSFLRFAPLYIIYLVWEGSKSYLNIPENKQVAFVIVSSIVILLSPAIIERIMFFLMPGIKT